MVRVLIVDYEMGNIDSIYRAMEDCGGNPVISNKSEDFDTATHIILPGVGSYNAAMLNIAKLKLDSILHEKVILRNKPLLGICLGMQILSSRGVEGGDTRGLGFIDGDVVRLRPVDKDTRIPHVGWNDVVHNRKCPLFDCIPNGGDFYFVHSYHFCPKNDAHVLATTPYCGSFTSVVGFGNTFGVQFHPEKSQRLGFQLLKNFLKM